MPSSSSLFPPPPPPRRRRFSIEFARFHHCYCFRKRGVVKTKVGRKKEKVREFREYKTYFEPQRSVRPWSGYKFHFFPRQSERPSFSRRKSKINELQDNKTVIQTRYFHSISKTRTGKPYPGSSLAHSQSRGPPPPPSPLSSLPGSH